MTELLTFLVSHLSYLYDIFGARFIDSKAQGGNALLVMECGNLHIRLVRDRDQIFLDFQERGSQLIDDDEWFSVDVIEQLITGVVNDNAVMDDNKARFIQDYFREIDRAFAHEQVEETRNRLRTFEIARAKRLFG